MVLNEAITKLTNEWDENAAKLVVEFGNKLPKAKLINCAIIYRNKDRGTMSGHTREGGEITVKIPERNEKKEIELGIKKERVGWFKLWKEKQGVINFHHFWASDAITKELDSENDSLGYRLEYDSKTLIPYSLSIWQKGGVLGLGVLSFSLFYLVSIYGKPKRLSILDKLLPRLGLNIGY